MAVESLDRHLLHTVLSQHTLGCVLVCLAVVESNGNGTSRRRVKRVHETLPPKRKCLLRPVTCANRPSAARVSILAVNLCTQIVECKNQRTASAHKLGEAFHTTADTRKANSAKGTIDGTCTTL